MIINSPAKLNRFLAILNKRTDGYHNMELITTVLDRSYNLMDTVEVTLSSNKTTLEISGPMSANIPTDENNLVIKAWGLLEKTLNKKVPVNINLNKCIPHGAGLGGGSSNAAAILSLGNELLGLKLSKATILGLGAQIGSDVPLFLIGGTVLGLDRGDRVFSLSDIPVDPIIIIYPKVCVPTKKVYEALANVGYPEYETCSSLNKGDVPALRNDLTNAAIAVCPELNMVRLAIMASGGKPLLCGSGSCWAAIYRDIDSRNKAYNKLRDISPHWDLWEIGPY